MIGRIFLFLGALNATLVVVAGAYGAHAPEAPAQAALFHTAVQYHMFHALGLLAIGVVATLRPGVTLFTWAGGLMFLGILLFCGSLYLHAFTGYAGLRAITPFGGTALILSWALLGIGFLRF